MNYTRQQSKKRREEIEAAKDLIKQGYTVTEATRALGYANRKAAQTAKNELNYDKIIEEHPDGLYPVGNVLCSYCAYRVKKATGSPVCGYADKEKDIGARTKENIRICSVHVPEQSIIHWKTV